MLCSLNLLHGTFPVLKKQSLSPQSKTRTTTEPKSPVAQLTFLSPLPCSWEIMITSHASFRLPINLCSSLLSLSSVIYFFVHLISVWAESLQYLWFVLEVPFFLPCVFLEMGWSEWRKDSFASAVVYLMLCFLPCDLTAFNFTGCLLHTQWYENLAQLSVVAFHKLAYLRHWRTSLFSAVFSTEWEPLIPSVLNCLPNS